MKIPPYVTVQEASRRLSVSRQRVHAMIQSGKLEAFRPDEQAIWLVSTKSIDKRLNRKKKNK